MSRVLVLGAGGPAGENFTRAAQAAGHDVIGCDTDEHGLALSSAVVRERLTTSVSTRTDRAARVAEVNALIATHDVDVVHAQPDPEVAFLARAATHIEAATLIPDPAVIALCADKLEAARVISPDSPLSVALTEETADPALRLFGGRMWVRARTGAGSRAALPVDDVDLARAWCRYWDARCVPLMAAAMLPGRDLSWTGVYDRGGSLVASATKERIALLGAQSSPAGISSTARVQRIVHRPDAASVARCAVAAVDPAPRGVYMVDMRETLDGRPLVTEINAGRFGTTSEFFAAAGANLPALLIDLAAGEDTGCRGEDVCRIGSEWARNTDMGARLLEAAPCA